MTPGPRKKNFNKRGGDNVVDTKKNIRNFPDSQSKEAKESSPSNIDNENNDSIPGNRKNIYSKRTVGCNWAKYEEPKDDPHTDSMRGEDFAVLSSYSGGSESQLQLQEERDWDETANDKSVTIDLQDLISAVKSIPFHKRINLPEDVFSAEQLSRFVSVAESSNASRKSKPDLSHVPQKMSIKEPECVDTSFNIESYESEDPEVNAPTKHFILQEKTENIIESLASCLSLKDIVSEKPAHDLNKDKKKPSPNAPDDLDFLLSLGVSSKNLKEEEKSSSKKQTNVDAWLNSILDD